MKESHIIDLRSKRLYLKENTSHILSKFIVYDLILFDVTIVAGVVAEIVYIFKNF